MPGIEDVAAFHEDPSFLDPFSRAVDATRDAAHAAGSRLKWYEAKLSFVVKQARRFDRAFAARIPGVSALAAMFRRIASIRWGRVPVGLLMLLPIALFIDIFDAGDELAGGFIGPIVSFFLETAFLLGLTGRASYAIGLAAFDIIPIVDIIPFATITLIREIILAWRKPVHVPPNEGPTGPIIDV